MLAMSYMQVDAVSPGNEKLLVIFLGVIAAVMVVQLIMQIGTGIAARKAIKGALDSLEEMKSKAYPMIDSIHELTLETHALISESTPKIRTITDNLVHTSETVKGSAQKFDTTITDLNIRTQRQVARVDGMIAVALTTTSELVETINQGIRGPAEKIAHMASQAKTVVEGFIVKARSMANGLIPTKRA